MKRLVVVMLVFASMTGCQNPSRVRAEPVIENAKFPAAFTLSPDNREIWYGERETGVIWRHDLDTGVDRRVYHVNHVLSKGEQGLVGLVLHPEYPAQPTLYAYATIAGDGAHNQLLEITIENGVGVSERVLFDVPKLSIIHQGGHLAFGPDGYLYATVGDRHAPENAQIVDDPTNIMGKILRMTPDATPAPGNPFPNSRIWAHGFRNSFGFAFDPANGNLWLNDNGPSCNDEVNRIEPGGNYAWGAAARCTGVGPENTNRDGPEPRLPVKFFAKAMGITGAAFCSDCGLGDDNERRLFISAITNGEVHRMTLDDERTGIADDKIVYTHAPGIAAIQTAPGQPLYFSDMTGIYRLAR